jgi:hypothetical protein
MPACAFGAEPTEAARNTQAFVDRLSVPLAIAGLVGRVAPQVLITMGQELLDYNNLCAANVDPPGPITLEDEIAQWQWGLTAGLTGEPRVAQKVWDWIRYQQFLSNCVCKLPPVDPTKNCTNAPASFALGALGSVSAAFPVDLEQSVLDSWTTFANGDWQWHAEAKATVSGSATTGDNLIVEYLNVNGVWQNTTADLQLFNADPDCVQFEFQASVPKMGTSTAVRIRNAAGGTYTITNFQLCFCPVASFPPPLPVQPPLDTVPDAPVPVCSTEDICSMLTELLKRQGTQSAQISDLQAQATAGDVLRELNRQGISGEGEATLAVGTRGVSLELSGVAPPVYTSALGRPRGLMRAGSIRWRSGGAYTKRVFIDAELMHIRRPFNVEAISYQLINGVTAQLVQLG